MQKKRVQYLDVIKVISIFLVVFCHFVLLAPSIPDNIAMVACWCGVPMFFMVNGALLFSRPLNLPRHIRKTVTIYLVLLAWRLIYLFVIGAACHVPFGSFGKNQLFLYLFAFGSLEGIGTGHLWFIEALLAVYLLFPLFRIGFEQPYGRKLLLFFGVYGLLVTNGLTGAQMLLDALAGAGMIGACSLEGLEVLNPFGLYANMLGFFLLGAWLHTGPFWNAEQTGGSGGRAGEKGAPAGEKSAPAGEKSALADGAAKSGPGPAKRRVLGGILAVSGLAGMWGVKWYTSGDPAWDGILLVQGYRHLPVILLALGIFLLCRELHIRNRYLSAAVEAIASRTLGIYYLHWIFGWILVPWLALCFPSFNLGTNLLKTILLILPALACTFVIERIPVLKHLVTG